MTGSCALCALRTTQPATGHAETLAAAAAMLGLAVPQLRSKARQLRVALPFAARGSRRP